MYFVFKISKICINKLDSPYPAHTLLSYFFFFPPLLFHTIFIPSHILLGELITFLLCFCSLCSARMFTTLIAFCRRNTEVAELLFAATGRSTKKKNSRNNNDSVCRNISYRLIFFNFPGTQITSPPASSNTLLPPLTKPYSAYLSQERRIIKALQGGALFTLGDGETSTRVLGRMSHVCSNQITDRSHQSESGAGLERLR